MREIDRDELHQWLDYNQTIFFLDLLEKEVVEQRKVYDVIEIEGKGDFKKNQGYVRGLLKAIKLARNIHKTEV